jgi:hypothetical protein
MPVERRERVTCIKIVRVNGQPEELDGSDGRRQPLIGGTSRMNREIHVRICERLGVQLPGATRPWPFAFEHGDLLTQSQKKTRMAARESVIK